MRSGDAEQGGRPAARKDDLAAPLTGQVDAACLPPFSSSAASRPTDRCGAAARAARRGFAGRAEEERSGVWRTDGARWRSGRRQPRAGA